MSLVIKFQVNLWIAVFNIRMLCADLELKNSICYGSSMLLEGLEEIFIGVVKIIEIFLEANE
jgi:hypothetical protein